MWILACEVLVGDSEARVRRGGGRAAFPFGAGGAPELAHLDLERVECRAIRARVLVGVEVADGIALRAAPVAGIGRALHVLLRLALVADAPAVQLGSRPATVSGLVVLAAVEVCAVVDVTAGQKTLQSIQLRGCLLP